MFASCSSSFQRTTAPVLQAAVRNQAARYLSGVEMVPLDAILVVTEALKKAINVRLEFTAGGNTVTDGAKVSGSIDSNMAIKEHGLKLREKWNTDNSIGATVDYEKLMPGLRLEGAVQGQLKSGHQLLVVHSGADRVVSVPLLS